MNDLKKLKLYVLVVPIRYIEVRYLTGYSLSIRSLDYVIYDFGICSNVVLCLLSSFDVILNSKIVQKEVLKLFYIIYNLDKNLNKKSI